MNTMANPEQKKIFLTSLLLSAAFGGLLISIAAAGITLPSCSFFRLTGLYCPGCGGTRACIALLHGHFLRSLVYHPVVLYGTTVYTVYAVRNLLALFAQRTGFPLQGMTSGMAFRNIYLYIAVALILANWVLKNILLCTLHLAL